MNSIMPNQNGPMPMWAMGQQPPQRPAVPMFSVNGGAPPPGGPPSGAPPGAAMGRPPSGPAGMGQQQMSPEFIKQLMEGHGLAQEQSDIGRRRKLADQLRADGMGLLDGASVGGMHAAPGLAQLAGSVYNSYKGAQADEAIDKDQKTITGKKSRNAEDWFKSLIPQQPQQAGG